MKKTLAICLCMGLLLFALTGCSGKAAALDGTYEAVNPPMESGDVVIQTLVFSGKNVTMGADGMEQTVAYQIAGDTFTILTDYGDFAYAYECREDGTLVIDNVTYRPL